jgi:hypothetical protein
MVPYRAQQVFADTIPGRGDEHEPTKAFFTVTGPLIWLARVGTGADCVDSRHH